MKPAVRRARRRAGALLFGLLLALAVAAPAGASPETIKRSVTNILFGPVDFVLGPIVGTRTVYYNIQDIDDTTAVRVFYVIPGVAWNSAMEMGGGVLRLFTGVLEFLPGLVLIPFEADMDSMFAPVERADALVDEDFDWIQVKFGINYVD